MQPAIYLGGRGRLLRDTQPGWRTMDHYYGHSDENIRESDDAVCPRCDAQPRFVIAVLDSRIGKTFRMFECRCGEIVWTGPWRA